MYKKKIIKKYDKFLYKFTYNSNWLEIRLKDRLVMNHLQFYIYIYIKKNFFELMNQYWYIHKYYNVKIHGKK